MRNAFGPTEGLGTSPVQQHLDRPAKTLTSYSWKPLHQAYADTTAQRLPTRKDRQSFYYNSGSKVPLPLDKGDLVRIRPSKLGKR